MYGYRICPLDMCSFFYGSFSHLFDTNSLDSRIELHFIELCLAIRITFILTKIKVLA